MNIIKKVENPNLVEDMLYYLSLECSEADLRAALDRMAQDHPETLGRMEVFIDRIEFIDHLDEIVALVFALPTPFKWTDSDSEEHEVVGVENDIEALRLYLALTCVDIFSDKSLGVGVRFKKVFDDAAQDLVDDLTNNLTVDGKKDLQSIVEALYSIRNNYTHDGVRFHNLRNIPVRQSQQIPLHGGSSGMKLTIAPRFNLIGAVLNIAVFSARKSLAEYSIC